MAGRSARDVAKRRQQAAVVRKQKRKLKAVRNTTPALASKLEGLVDGLMDELKDFRPLPFIQAMMHYARPLMDMSPGEDLAPTPDIFQMAVSIWNYASPLAVSDRHEKQRRELIKAISSTFRVDKAEGARIFEMMVERREFLMPQDLQLPNPFFMFVRRDVSYLLSEFDYARIKFSADPAPRHDDDEAWLSGLRELDSWVRDGGEVWEYEDDVTEVKDKLFASFWEWLPAKGLEEFADDFHFYAGTYFEFVYECDHGKVVTLESVPVSSLEKFFSDFVLRKALTQPTKYPTCPAAVMFLYKFLEDKGYIRNAKPMIRKVGELEPIFFMFLKELFG